MTFCDLQRNFHLIPFDEKVVKAFRRGKFSRAYRSGLEMIDSNLPVHSPPNFLPLVVSGDGDLMGYYFPKGSRGKPFVAVQYVNEDSDKQLFPMNCELSTVFLKPHEMKDAVSDENVDGNWAFLKECPEWEGLVIAHSNEVVGLADMLKPMSLNWRFLSDVNQKTKGVLPGGEVLFKGGRDFREIDCWLELADYLESNGDVAGTLKALENAIAVLWPYPSHGGYYNNVDKLPRVGGEIWRRISGLDGLDGFDSALCQCMLRSLENVGL